MPVRHVCIYMMSKLLEDSQVLGGVFWCFSWKVQLRKCASIFGCRYILFLLHYTGHWGTALLLQRQDLCIDWAVAQILTSPESSLVPCSHCPKLVIPQNHSYFFADFDLWLPFSLIQYVFFQGFLNICLFLEYLFVSPIIFGFRKSLFYYFQGFRVEMVR